MSIDIQTSLLQDFERIIGSDPYLPLSVLYKKSKLYGSQLSAMNALKRGEIAHLKLGNRRLIPRSALLAHFMASIQPLKHDKAISSLPDNQNPQESQ